MKPQKSDALYVVIIVLAFLLGLAAHLPIPVPSSTISGQTEQPNSTDKDRKFQGDGHAITANPQSGTNQADQGGYESSTNWWIAVFTGALVLVAVLQWLTSRSQTNSLESGLALTREQNAISRVSSEAAKQSAEAAIAALHAQRAHIIFDGISIVERSGHGTDFAISVTFGINWRNGGQTAAIQGICLMDHVEFIDQLPQVFKFPTIWDAPCSILTLESQGRMTVPLVLPSQVLVDVFERRPAKHFFFGWIAYRDIFSDTPIRLTEFCCEAVGISVEILGMDIRHRDSKFTMHFQSRDQHNGTDENCLDYQARTAQYERLMALSSIRHLAIQPRLSP